MWVIVYLQALSLSLSLSLSGIVYLHALSLSLSLNSEYVHLLHCTCCVEKNLPDEWQTVKSLIRCRILHGSTLFAQACLSHYLCLIGKTKDASYLILKYVTLFSLNIKVYHLNTSSYLIIMETYQRRYIFLY